MTPSPSLPRPGHPWPRNHRQVLRDRLRAFFPALVVAFLSLGGFASIPGPDDDRPSILVVVGAAGEAEFGTNFLEQANLWAQACEKANARHRVIGLEPGGGEEDVVRLQKVIEEEAPEGGDWWLVLIGHGTYDGRDAKFNLRGSDLSASNLVTWLRPMRRRTAIIDTTSSSAPFLKALSSSNRVVITATRSGNEQNYTRFGGRFAEAIADPSGDLDQDGQTSLLEAFLSAAFRVTDFYKSQGRLATEHPILDDNGDGLGTPAEWFRGLRAVKRPRDSAALDGLRAHQMHLARSEAELRLSPETRAHRDALEVKIADLREGKSRMPEADYYDRLEALLIELARLYQPEGETAPSPRSTP